MIEISAQFAVVPLFPRKRKSLFVDHEEELRQMVADGKSINGIAVEFGVTYERVQYALRRLGLRAKRPNRRADLRDDRWPEIIRQREAGKSYNQIGQPLGITAERVRQILHKAGRSDLCCRIDTRTTLQCATCGKEFKRLPSSIKAARRHFCSGVCARNRPPTKHHQLVAMECARLRMLGHTWEEVGRVLKRSAAQRLCGYTKEYFDRAGVEPPPGVFGVWRRSS